MFIQQNQKISFQPHFGIFSFFLLDSQLHDYLLFSLFSSINNYSSKEEWEKILFPGIFFFGEEKKWKWNEGKSLLIIIRVNFSLIISVRYKNNNLSKDFNLNYSRSIIIPFLHTNSALETVSFWEKEFPISYFSIIFLLKWIVLIKGHCWGNVELVST